MACKGCAKRMRRLLKRAGYTYREETNDWLSPEGKTVSDDDVEEHHSREAARLLVEKLKRYV